MSAVVHAQQCASNPWAIRMRFASVAVKRAAFEAKKHKKSQRQQHVQLGDDLSIAQRGSERMRRSGHWQNASDACGQKAAPTFIGEVFYVWDKGGCDALIAQFLRRAWAHASKLRPDETVDDGR